LHLVWKPRELVVISRRITDAYGNEAYPD